MSTNGGCWTGEIPTLRGHLLNEEDRLHREQILQFMTQQVVVLQDDEQTADARDYLCGTDQRRPGHF